MKKKLIGILVCMLLITITLPVSASYEENNEIETQDDWIVGKIRYFGLIRGYTIRNFTNCQFYEVDFINGFKIVTALFNGIPGIGFQQLREMEAIPLEAFRGILTDHLCIGVERLHS